MGLLVRPATPSDLDWLVQELRLFSKFFGTKRELFGDEAFTRAGLLTIMEKHLCLVADKDPVGPVGFIVGLVTPHVFNPSIRVLAEGMWWVDEGHRGTRAGILLLSEFLAWGQKNADWITFSLIEGASPVNEETLIRRGFKLQERSYLLEV